MKSVRSGLDSPVAGGLTMGAMVRTRAQLLNIGHGTRAARRAVERDLSDHLEELAATQPVVAASEAAWMSGVVALQLPGHQLVLGGVRPLMAWDVLAMTYSPVPPVLAGAGRYGKLWWVTIRGETEQVVLASHLQLTHDGGRAGLTETELPILSGAR
jgi:hypothetical protein